MKNKEYSVGILTFHASHNAGSMLQAFALKYFLEQLFQFKIEFINFSNNEQKDLYSIFPDIKKPKHIIRNTLYLLNYSVLKRHFTGYENFKAEYMDIKNPIMSEIKELKLLNNSYDIVISGGDQIWNTSCTDGDDAYFLNFLHGPRKISYSASMGATNILDKSEKEKKKYRNYLEKFYMISVRERNAKLWLEELLPDKNISIQPDPTLLLSDEVWSSLVKNTIIKEPYIFLYSMAFNKEICELVKIISIKYDMPVYVMDAKAWIKKRLNKYKFRLTKESGPLVFLNLMKNASLIITNSLHGTMFSALFEKCFWSMKSYVHNDNDDRATFLLEQLGLEQRFIETDKFDIDLAYTEVDYKMARKKISLLKEEAIEFLTNAITM